MEQPIRVFLISDHCLFLEAVANIISTKEEISLVGSSTNPNRAFECAQLQLIDVMLIDAALKNRDAVCLTQEIKDGFPEIKIIVLGLTHSTEDILQFIQSGASGYVLKESSFDELLQTIISVYYEQTPCSSKIAAAVFRRVTELSREQHSLKPIPQNVLTAREKDILRLIAAGLSNKEIACQLCISFYTVKNHVHNIFEKLNVRYRREAVRYTHSNLSLVKGLDSSSVILP